jgi:hypothetical protein
MLPPRKARAFSYEEQQAKTANLRRVEVLVTQLLDAGDDTEAAGAAAQALWHSAPRPAGPPVPLDLPPWTWMREAAVDGYRLGESVTTAKLALAAEVWHILVSRDPSLEARSCLRRPDPDNAVGLFGAGLGAIVGADARFPLFVLRRTTYSVEPLTALFASRLLELRRLGVAVDPATMHLAETVARR